MFLRRILPIGAILIAGLIFFYRSQNPCMDYVDKTHTESWTYDFEVRGERKIEKCSFVPGALYTFSSRRKNSGNWREIMTFRHDDAVDVSSGNIDTVNDKVAVIQMGWKAAVTSDGGETWNLWDAEKEIPNWTCCNYFLITKIDMSENGEAIMRLDPIPGRNEPKELFTDNFGKTWKQTK